MNPDVFLQESVTQYVSVPSTQYEELKGTEAPTTLYWASYQGKDGSAGAEAFTSAALAQAWLDALADQLRRTLSLTNVKL